MYCVSQDSIKNDIHKPFRKKCSCGFSHKFVYNTIFHKYFAWCGLGSNYIILDSKDDKIC